MLSQTVVENKQGLALAFGNQLDGVQALARQGLPLALEDRDHVAAGGGRENCPGEIAAWRVQTAQKRTQALRSKPLGEIASDGMAARLSVAVAGGGGRRPRPFSPPRLSSLRARARVRPADAQPNRNRKRRKRASGNASGAKEGSVCSRGSDASAPAVVLLPLASFLDFHRSPPPPPPSPPLAAPRAPRPGRPLVFDPPRDLRLGLRIGASALRVDGRLGVSDVGRLRPRPGGGGWPRGGAVSVVSRVVGRVRICVVAFVFERRSVVVGWCGG